MTTIEQFKKIYSTGYRHVYLSIADDIDGLNLKSSTLTGRSTLRLLGIEETDSVAKLESLSKFSRKNIVVASVNLSQLKNFSDLEQVVSIEHEFYHRHSKYELIGTCSLGHLISIIERGALIIMQAFKGGQTYEILQTLQFKDNSYSLPKSYDYLSGSAFHCNSVWTTRFGDLFLKDKNNESRCPLDGFYSAAGGSYGFYDPRFFEMA